MAYLDKCLLIDVLNILPEEVDCLIQAPSLKNEPIQRFMVDSEVDFYKLLKLNKANKANFIHQELSNSIGDYFQNIQIKQGNKLLFEGYDGVEFGILSKDVNIPKWFKEKYIPDTCIVADEW